MNANNIQENEYCLHGTNMHILPPAFTVKHNCNITRNQQSSTLNIHPQSNNLICCSASSSFPFSKQNPLSAACTTSLKWERKLMDLVSHKAASRTDSWNRREKQEDLKFAQHKCVLQSWPKFSVVGKMNFWNHKGDKIFPSGESSSLQHCELCPLSTTV